MNVHSLTKRQIQTYFALAQLAGRLMEEATECHALLDVYDVPREQKIPGFKKGYELSLKQRLQYLIQSAIVLPDPPSEGVPGSDHGDTSSNDTQDGSSLIPSQGEPESSQQAEHRKSQS